MTVALAGITGTSAPSWASGIEPAPSISPAVLVVNTPAPAPVPATLDAAPEATVQPAVVETKDDAAFASLEDAVSAQDTVAADDQLRCLATAIYFESKSEPLAGQLAVAQVILNRSKSGRFADSACGVVTQRGQFSFVHGGKLPSIDPSSRQFKTAVAVAKVALAASWASKAPKALYFNTPGIRPAAHLTRIAAIGNHIFYR